MEYMENQMDDLITGANLQQEESNSFKLISMTDFVLEQSKELSELPNLAQTTKAYMNSYHYAQFLKQSLTLGMFVPCDEEGNVLEEPIISEYLLDSPSGSPIKSKNTPEAYYYRKAKERVLFEGFEVKTSNITNSLQNDFLIISETNEIIGHENKDQWFFNPYKKVEDLIPFNLTLTPTAIKQIGL